MAKNNSRTLASRLVQTAVLWGGIALAVTAIFAVILFGREAYTSLDEDLASYRTTLIADIAADAEVNSTSGPRMPAFDTPLSGWYWFVRRADDEEMLGVSRSLQGDVIITPDQFLSADQSNVSAFATGPDNQLLRILGGRYEVEIGQNSELQLIDVVVAGDFGMIIGEVVRFAAFTCLILGLLVLGLVLAISMQVRVGLRPVESIRNQLVSIRSGRQNQIEGDYPDDLAPLATELNTMIDANRDLVERARTQAGNLAHALKTPLSVLTNEARQRDDPFGSKVIEQVGIMRDQVERHLARARQAAQAMIEVHSTPLSASVHRLAQTMERVHAHKDLLLDVEMPEEVAVRVEAKDFDDMLGNVIDNACKWTSDTVVVRGVVRPPKLTDLPGTIEITVTDNGPGLPPDKMTEVLRRGKRLDETTPGSGLGLSIVSDLARLYGGSVALSAAKPNGLSVVLVLPLTTQLPTERR